jgi:hypothetical protein
MICILKFCFFSFSSLRQVHWFWVTGTKVSLKFAFTFGINMFVTSVYILTNGRLILREQHVVWISWNITVRIATYIAKLKKFYSTNILQKYEVFCKLMTTKSAAGLRTSRQCTLECTPVWQMTPTYPLRSLEVTCHRLGFTVRLPTAPSQICHKRGLVTVPWGECFTIC